MGFYSQRNCPYHDDRFTWSSRYQSPLSLRIWLLHLWLQLNPINSRDKIMEGSEQLSWEVVNCDWAERVEVILTCGLQWCVTYSHTLWAALAAQGLIQVKFTWVSRSIICIGTKWSPPFLQMTRFRFMSSMSHSQGGDGQRVGRLTGKIEIRPSPIQVDDAEASEAPWFDDDEGGGGKDDGSDDDGWPVTMASSTMEPRRMSVTWLHGYLKVWVPPMIQWFKGSPPGVACVSYCFSWWILSLLQRV